MNSLPDSIPNASDLSGRTITLTLALHGAETVYLRSCEIMGKGFRNRISFTEKNKIEDVFVERMSASIRSCLHSLPDSAHVLALPDFILELPGLVLSGVHVMILEAKNNVRNAILRFKDFLGAIDGAFRMDTGFQETFADYSEKLAVSVLEDICLPILNLSRSFANLDFGNDEQRARAFSERAQEFEFQTELLKRFIFNASMGHSEPPLSYLHAETEQRPSQIPF